MMGAALSQQGRLFYVFDLEAMVPVDHLLRRIDAVLDLSWLREELKPHYSSIGRPSVCPELMGCVLNSVYRSRAMRVSDTVTR